MRDASRTFVNSVGELGSASSELVLVEVEPCKTSFCTPIALQEYCVRGKKAANLQNNGKSGASAAQMNTPNGIFLFQGATDRPFVSGLHFFHL